MICSRFSRRAVRSADLMANIIYSSSSSISCSAIQACDVGGTERDQNWYVYGKNNALSFPSYYIDEDEYELELLQKRRNLHLLILLLHVTHVISGIMLSVLNLTQSVQLKILGFARGAKQVGC
jgi:hypothetical protein